MLDISKYRVNVRTVAQILAGKTPAERLKLVSNIAVATMCPIIAVCWFTGELYGFDRELLKLIETLKIFYKITEIKT